MIAAVTQCGESLDFADPSLQDDLEVKLVAARHTSATNALNVVRQLKNLPDWQEKEKLLNRAVELTVAFPDSVLSPSALPPKVHNKLTRVVEQMLKQAMKAEFDANGNAIMVGRGAKRAREEYEVGAKRGRIALAAGD